MSVAFTVAGSAAAENVIWMVALAATCVVPDAGVIDFTEKAAAGVGLTGAVLLPLPQPVKSAKDKAIEETKLQKRNVVPSFIEPTVVYASGRNQSSLSNINQAPAVRQTLGTCSAADARGRLALAWLLENPLIAINGAQIYLFATRRWWWGRGVGQLPPDWELHKRYCPPAQRSVLSRIPISVRFGSATGNWMLHLHHEGRPAES
jgi:hypothetical protein